LDQSAKVASSAAFWLSRVGGDPAGVLRKHVMSTEPIVPAALSILGTFGKPEDHRALLQVATAHSGRTRWAALSSATQLARSAVLPQIKEIAVGDDTAEATRAVRLLVELGEGLAFEELSLWAKKPEQFADRRYLDLTHKLVPWRALAIILTLALHGVPVEFLRPHLELIFERSRRNWLPNASERVQLIVMLERLPVSHSRLLQSLRWVIEHSS
jgi:hypothetical protein